MNARDITLGLRVRVRAVLSREPKIQEGEYGLQSWSWERKPVEAEPIVGIVAAIRTKNNGRMEMVGEFDAPSFEYQALTYMRAALVYSSLHRSPVWALLDDIEVHHEAQAGQGGDA